MLNSYENQLIAEPSSVDSLGNKEFNDMICLREYVPKLSKFI